MKIKTYGNVRIVLFNARQMIVCLLAAMGFALAVKTCLLIFQPADKKIIENAALILVVLLSLYFFSPPAWGSDLAGRWFFRYLQPGDLVSFYYPKEMYGDADELPDGKTEGNIVSIMKGSMVSIKTGDRNIELPVNCITKILSGDC